MRNIVKERWKNYRWQIWSVIIAASVSFILVMADYWVQNSSFPLFDDAALLAWVDEVLGEKMDAKKSTFFDEKDVTYVNFGKDKALVWEVDMFGDTIGNVVITDRETLLRFLELAGKSRYKYIFLDVRFEKGLETPFDSALFQQIKAMPRLVVATHRNNGGYAMADSSLLAKAAYADYRSTIFSGFTRYEFLQDGCRSVALQMLHDIDNQDIEEKGCAYYTDRHRCYNMKYIPLPHYLFKGKSETVSNGTIGEELRYPYAGSMILNPEYISKEEVIKNLFDDKIVIAGDFDNDLHDTYIGEIPGPVLSLAAYKYLHAGLHKVKWVYRIFLFVLYFVVAYFTILSGGHIGNFIEKYPVAHFIISLLGLALLFYIVKILLYCFFLISMVMIVPTIIFWVGSTISLAIFECQKNKPTKSV